MIALLREIYALVGRRGRKRLAAVLVLVVAQSAAQTLAVFSLLPFLAAAADVAAFRASAAGARFVAAIGGGDDRRVLLVAGGLALALLVAGNLLAMVTDYARSRYAHGFAHDLRVRLVRALLARRYEWFLGANSSVLLKHLVEDVSVIATSLVMPALDVFARVLLVVLLAGAALLVEPEIVLGGAVVVALFYLLAMRPVKARAEAVSDSVKAGFRALYFELGQLLGAVKPIIAGERAAWFAGRVERASRALAAASPQLQVLTAIPRAGLEVLVFGGLIAWIMAAVAGGNDLAALIPRIGLIAAIAYRVLPSVQAVFVHAAAMTASRQALEEVRDLLAEQDGLAEAKAATEGTLGWRELRFENVSFRYASAPDGPGLRDASLTIASGSRIAVVGPTGAGKSTLVDLLLGLLTPTAGRILIDGAPLDAGNLAAWRRSIGYVPQDLFILDASLEDNVAFGAEPDPEAVAEALALAEAAALDRAGTGERGNRLSGGERQRLGLARALFTRPSLVVLDEATSALDTATESRIAAALAALAKAPEPLTIVAVTHRLEAVREFDCIHWIENGRIAASGDFASVMRARGANAQNVPEIE